MKECHKVTGTNSTEDAPKVRLTFLAAEQKHLTLKDYKIWLDFIVFNGLLFLSTVGGIG